MYKPRKTTITWNTTSLFYSLSWDSNVRDSLQQDFYFIDGYRSNNTIFRDLVAHRTGISRNDALTIMGGLERSEIIEYVTPLCNLKG